MDYVRDAWEAFVSGDDPAPPAVPASILASWRRSRELAVSPELRAGPWAAPREDDVTREFAAAGASAVRELAADLRGAGCVVVLADAGGVVRARAGDPDVTRRTDVAQLAPGGAWSERAAGTNSIGLALELGRPVQVVAAEHFCVGWQDFGCTSALVHHPLTGAVLGTLTLTTRAHVHDRPIVAALAGRTARAVEHDLGERLAGPLREVERAAIMGAIQRAGGNVSAAAEELGISRATIYRRLRTYRVLSSDA